MRIRTLAAAVLLSLAPAMSAAPSWAQPSGSEDPLTAAARARFKEGVDFYDKGQFEQARAAFLQAYALKKHPTVLLNLAWSCVKSGHAIEAEKYFKQFLAEGKDITDKQRADANDGLVQAHSKLGRIEVVAPAGTDVVVDGERVGLAPLMDPVAVEAGAHTVKFKAPDGTTDTQSVSVLGGEKAQARFGKAASTPAPAPAPPPTPASPPAAAPTAQPAQTATPAATSQPASEAAAAPPPGPESPKKDLLAPPKNLVPVWIFGGVAVAGYITAVVALVFKGTAQDNANSVAAEITRAGGGAGTCNNPTRTFAQACGAFVSDNNDVNSDATAGNVGLAFGIAATLGAGIYWLAADKSEPGAAGGPVVTPIVTRSTGGLSIAGRF